MKTASGIFALLLLFVCSISVSAQSIPQEAVDTWTYSSGPDYQVVTFYSDGTYNMYWKHDSLDDAFNDQCTSQVMASQGSAAFSSRSVTLTQKRVYRINYPKCAGQGANAVVQTLTPQQSVLTTEFTGDDNLILNGVFHWGTYQERTLRPIPLSAGVVPSALIGDWSKLYASLSGMGSTEDYKFAADGSYSLFTYFSSDSCKFATNFSGTVHADDLLLTVHPLAGEIENCSGLVHDADLDEEQRVWWVVNDSVDGILLYIDGFRYTLESIPVQSLPAVSNSAPLTLTSEFSDNFSSNRVDWEVGNGEGYASTFVDGAYVMDFSANASSVHWLVAPGFTNWSLAPQFSAPFTFETDVQGSCSATCGVGLLFGVQQGYSDLMQIAYAKLSPNEAGWGLYDGGSLSDDDVLLSSGSVSNPIDIFDGQTHRLHLEVGSSDMEFSIDNRLIAEATGQWQTTGSIGVTMLRDPGAALHLEFDNLSISQ